MSSGCIGQPEDMASDQTTRGERFARSSDDGPDHPGQMPRRSWGGVLKRTFTEFKADNLTDWAAALTYYGIQALFPALLVLVSILGLLGSGTTQSLIDNLGAVAPGTAKDTITSAIRNLQSSKSSAGILFIVGLVAALWSASSYIGAFTRASNSIYEVGEGRPFWKLRPQQMLITLVMVVLLAVSAFAVVITGGLAEQVGKLIGVGSTAVQVWDIAKWPVLVVLVSLMFAVLYWAAPNVKQPGFKWVSPGSLLAVIVWLIASAAFALYVANFSNYNKTYGSLGGVIVFLVWLWISNVAVLLGAEFDAELQRGRQMQRGQAEDHEPILPPRDTRKLND
jgi:membrane protein